MRKWSYCLPRDVINDSSVSFLSRRMHFLCQIAHYAYYLVLKKRYLTPCRYPYCYYPVVLDFWCKRMWILLRNLTDISWSIPLCMQSTSKECALTSFLVSIPVLIRGSEERDLGTMNPLLTNQHPFLEC